MAKEKKQEFILTISKAGEGLNIACTNTGVPDVTVVLELELIVHHFKTNLLNSRLKKIIDKSSIGVG